MQTERRRRNDRRSGRDRRRQLERTRGPRVPPGERQRLEALVDETVADTFPASDPPMWDSLRARLEGGERA